MSIFLLFIITFITFIGIAVIVFVILAKTGHFNIFNKIKSIFSKNTNITTTNGAGGPGNTPGSNPSGGYTDEEKCLLTAASYCPGDISTKSEQDECCSCMRNNLEKFEKVPSCSRMGAQAITRGTNYDKFVANYCVKECY